MAGKKMREKLLNRQKSLKDRSKGGNYFTIKEGTTRMRHVPIENEEEFAFEAIFFFLGKELGGVISPATFGEKCAIMNMHNKLKESKKESDREFAKKHLRISKKFFSPVYKYKDEKGKEVDTEAGVKLLMMTPGMYQEAIEMFLDEDELGDFTNANEGYDLKYSRSGKGMMDTEYSVKPCKPTKAAKEFAKKEYNPEEMVRALVPSYEKTKELIEKFMNMGHDDDDQGSKKSSKKDKKNKDKKKKKSKDL